MDKSIALSLCVPLLLLCLYASHNSLNNEIIKNPEDFFKLKELSFADKVQAYILLLTNVTKFTEVTDITVKNNTLMLLERTIYLEIEPEGFLYTLFTYKTVMLAMSLFFYVLFLFRCNDQMMFTVLCLIPWLLIIMDAKKC